MSNIVANIKRKYKHVDFLRCNICRRSYPKNTNHIYSTSHVDSVKKVLSKFTLKVHSARSCLNSPVIKNEDSYDQKCSRFWCYFCSKEFPKHFVFDNHLYLENAGLLEHISSTRHMLMTKAFWRNNRIRAKGNVKSVKITKKESRLGFVDELKSGQRILQDYYKDISNSGCLGVNSSLSWKVSLKRHQKGVDVNKHSPLLNGVDELEKSTLLSGGHSFPLDLTMDLFMLPALDFNSFITNCKQCIDRYFTERDKQLNQDANYIANCSKKRLQMMEYFQKQMSRSAELGGHSGGQKTRQHIVPKTIGSVRTISAFGEGLTCIGIPKVDNSVGNVYTDAPPPWLQTSENSKCAGSHVVIGPTAEDFKKHLERQKKLKLPPTRVGVNFDHLTATGVNDLPSFGGVWSKNRRSHQQAGFKKTLHQTAARGFGRGSRPATTVSYIRGVSNVFNGRDSSEMEPLPRRLSQSGFVAIGNLRSSNNVTITNPGAYQRKRSNCSQNTSNSDVTGGRLNVASNLL